MICCIQNHLIDGHGTRTIISQIKLRFISFSVCLLNCHLKFNPIKLLLSPYQHFGVPQRPKPKSVVCHYRLIKRGGTTTPKTLFCSSFMFDKFVICLFYRENNILITNMSQIRFAKLHHAFANGATAKVNQRVSKDTTDSNVDMHSSQCLKSLKKVSF